MANEKGPGTEQIAEYIENLKFHRKAVGGCDEEDVLRKIGEICTMYEKVIGEIRGEYDRRSRELLRSMSQIRDYREHTLAKTKEEADEMIAGVRKEAEKEQQRLEQIRRENSARLEELKKENKEYCEKIRTILRQIEDISNEEA